MTDATTAAPVQHIVVMGVSGCGKSTIGALVAHELGLPFTDGDSLHPMANIAKMAAGTPLNDDDREPWLEIVGKELAGSANGLVVACSALKRSYRDMIRVQAPDVVFLHLAGTREVLGSRLEGRSGHFMPTALLDSQLATLEALDADERCVVIDISAPVPALVSDAVVRLKHRA
ncbi:carbohydrate kinase (thermoresistant glucokinase family) [Arthrobacter stackebrandtii]|uniref:Gluconokinase n=1 Tax=Arthrobacter stackebrandtii TaxID=272161 RepID=A0ABS4Z0R0_9MICC|nr:carbohydrate kinase (thermoresistant glucokinase family) [Arthrobacter stackebrandtii]